MTPLTHSERGRLGGKATVDRHGREHMARIGKLGFAALARKLGFAGGGRRGALDRLIRSGKVPAPPDLDADELAALQAEVGLIEAESLPF
jgi:hypothetical protein